MQSNNGPLNGNLTNSNQLSQIPISSLANVNTGLNQQRSSGSPIITKLPANITAQYVATTNRTLPMNQTLQRVNTPIPSNGSPITASNYTHMLQQQIQQQQQQRAASSTPQQQINRSSPMMLANSAGLPLRTTPITSPISPNVSSAIRAKIAAPGIPLNSSTGGTTRMVGTIPGTPTTIATTPMKGGQTTNATLNKSNSLTQQQQQALKAYHHQFAQLQAQLYDNLNLDVATCPCCRKYVSLAGSNLFSHLSKCNQQYFWDFVKSSQSLENILPKKRRESGFLEQTQENAKYRLQANLQLLQDLFDTDETVEDLIQQLESSKNAEEEQQLSIYNEERLQQRISSLEKAIQSTEERHSQVRTEMTERSTMFFKHFDELRECTSMEELEKCKSQMEQELGITLRSIPDLVRIYEDPSAVFDVTEQERAAKRSKSSVSSSLSSQADASAESSTPSQKLTVSVLEPRPKTISPSPSMNSLQTANLNIKLATNAAAPSNQTTVVARNKEQNG